MNQVLANKEMLTLMYARHTTAEIGEQIGVSSEAVRQALIRYGVVLRGKGARTDTDRVARAINRIRVELRRFGTDERKQIIDGLLSNK